jgi:hypothetical protein
MTSSAAARATAISIGVSAASSRRATGEPTPAALTDRQPAVWKWLVRETEQS